MYDAGTRKQFEITSLKHVDCPGGSDDQSAREEKDKLGELEEFGVDGGKGQGDKNREEVDGGDDDGLHGKIIAERT